MYNGFAVSERTQNVLLELEKYYIDWERIKKNGCYYSFKPDGEILNHIRTMIIVSKKKLEIIENDCSRFAIYNREIPQKVMCDYFADEDKVYERSKDALRQYQSSEIYAKMTMLMTQISSDIARKYYATDCYRMVTELAAAIKVGNLGKMRKYSCAAEYLLAMEYSVKSIERYLNGIDEIDTTYLYHFKELFS